MNSRKIQNIAYILIAILLFTYVGYQIYLANYKGIATETALYGTVSDTYQAECFAIRNESIIEESYSGVLNYRVADGTRVGTGGVIADVYSNEDDAAAQNSISRLETEIESLQSLSKPTEYYSSSSTSVSDQIYSSLNSLSLAVRSGSFTELSDLSDSLQTALNRRQLLTGDESADDYEQRIAELESEKSALEASAGSAVGTVEAPQAGYFISTTDGFENAVDISEVEDITPERVKELISQENGTGPRSSVGKICTDFDWYLVCVIPGEDSWRFEDVTEVNLDIPFASTQTIPAEIVSQNTDSETGEIAIVLKCSYMDSDIASIRCESVSIELHSYSGVLVNEKALRFEDVTYTETDEDGNEVEAVRENVKGVYIQSGRQLEFVQIFTETTINGYAICKTSLDDDEEAMLVTDSTIQLYDQVVVEGTDLYDGKPVR